jgi:hypothetical protein
MPEVEFNTELFLDTSSWFATESGHNGYRDVIPLDECLDPVVFLQDEDTQNNTDEPEDPLSLVKNVELAYPSLICL